MTEHKHGPAAYVWTDYETTGLDERHDHLLEVAFIVTDKELREIDRRSSLIQTTDEAWEQLNSNEYVKRMHHESGLWYELALKGWDAPTLGWVDRNTSAWLSALATPGETLRMAGGGVANFDWPWTKLHLPEVAALLHYRPLDISIVAQAFKDATGSTAMSKLHNGGAKAHRALADIEEDLGVARTAWDLLRKIPV